MARFPSKIDAWVRALLIAAIAGQVFALVVVVTGDVPGVAKAIVAVLVFAGVLLTTSVLYRTYYTVSDGKLRIVSGPFAWSIAIAEIRAIRESRNPLSSPALSLDRLSIHYDRDRRVLVSPMDKTGFLKAIEENST